MKKSKRTSKKSAKKTVRKPAKRAIKKAVRKSATKAARKPVKMPKIKKMPQKELEFFKKRLLFLRGKIAGDLQQIEGDSLSGNQPSSAGELSDVADMATDNYDRELNIGLASNEQQLLNDIDIALKKIEEGTYGVCEIYGTPIPRKRLIAMPYTRLSVRAQAEEEKNQRYS